MNNTTWAGVATLVAAAALTGAGSAMAAPQIGGTVDARTNAEWQQAHSDNVNIRSSPSVAPGTFVGQMDVGDIIIVTGTVRGERYGPTCGNASANDEWAVVDHWGARAYVAADCIDPMYASTTPQ